MSPFRRLGLIRWIWSLLFGIPEPLCASEMCGSVRDPRCHGLNCTSHCGALCDGTCVREHAIRDIRARMDRLGHRLQTAVDPDGGGSMSCESCDFSIVFTAQATQAEIWRDTLAGGPCANRQVREVMES